MKGARGDEMFETLNASSHSVGSSKRQGARGSHSARCYQGQSQESHTESQDCEFVNGRATRRLKLLGNKIASTTAPRFPKCSLQWGDRCVLMGGVSLPHLRTFRPLAEARFPFVMGGHECVNKQLCLTLGPNSQPDRTTSDTFLFIALP